jgi:GT2 family glycosyltransferase
MEALNTIGLFDPGYTPAYYEDTDLCWRLHQHQYTIVYVPQAVITHRESHSLRNAVTRSSYYNRGRLRFVLKSYAYTYITGTFAEHELEFMRKHGHAAEERALRWAYIETLLRLPDILQARRAFHPALSTEDMQELTRMLFAFKDGVTQSMYRRAYARLDAFTTL